ncbi:MAG: ThuA domain-containing protein [Rhodothermales bacterium]
MRKLTLLIAAILCLTSTPSWVDDAAAQNTSQNVAQNDGDQKTVLAILGDVWHRPAFLDRHLVGPLRDEGWMADVIMDYDVPWDDFENYDLIILSRYGQEDFDYYRYRDRNPDAERKTWMTLEQSMLFVEYVESGGSILLYHDGFGSTPCEFGTVLLARSCFISHPERIEITVSTLDGMPEITEGVADSFVVRDEEYVVEMDESETNVFLESHSPEHGRSPQGWAHTFGDGKVVVLIPGHFMDTIEHPMINRLIQNSLDWLNE